MKHLWPMDSLSSLMLDAQSRLIIREFLIQTAIGLAIMLALFVIRAQTLFELCQAAARVFTFYSALDCMRAWFGRIPVKGSSLSRWDQAAAYSFCAIFFDLLANWPR